MVWTLYSGDELLSEIEDDEVEYVQGPQQPKQSAPTFAERDATWQSPLREPGTVRFITPVDLGGLGGEYELAHDSGKRLRIQVGAGNNRTGDFIVAQVQEVH